jgi:hypothetical protein
MEDEAVVQACGNEGLVCALGLLKDMLQAR